MTRISFFEGIARSYCGSFSIESYGFAFLLACLAPLFYWLVWHHFLLACMASLLYWLVFFSGIASLWHSHRISGITLYNESYRISGITIYSMALH